MTINGFSGALPIHGIAQLLVRYYVVELTDTNDSFMYAACIEYLVPVYGQDTNGVSR